MPRKTYTITTTRNTWTFDVSLPHGGVPKIINTYGDVTNKENLDQAIRMLTALVDAELSATTLPSGFAVEKVRPQNTYMWDLFWGGQWCGTFKTKRLAITEANRRFAALKAA